MKRLVQGILLSLSLAALPFASTARAGGDTLLRAEVMFGVRGPFLDSPVIRGLKGDEDFWRSPAEAFVNLETDGDLFISVKGLVEGDNENPDPTFRGVVSCLTITNGQVVTRNIFTKPFAAGTRPPFEGDSIIAQRLTLPKPCVAPIVFVAAGDEDLWFAVTGQQ